MNYLLSNVHLKLRQLSDKMGSDYFPLPVFLNFFETATYDFVGECLKRIENTQTITDDIRDLIVPKEIVVIQDPNRAGKYIAAVPSDYLRQVAYDVRYADGSRCRRADVLKHAQKNVYRNDPTRKAEKDYPIILQYGSFFEIDSGSTVPKFFDLTYCKKPVFATTGEPGKRIVNLPDDAIEEVLKITVTGLFNKTADERQQSSYQLQESYRKVFR